MKHLIKEISDIANYISVNGNYNEIPRNTHYAYLDSEYRYFLSDIEFIKKYYPNLLQDDPDWDYEISFNGSLIITTNDGGTITFDWIDNSSGEVNIEIGDLTIESQLLYDFMTDKTKCKWWIDDSTLTIEEVN